MVKEYLVSHHKTDILRILEDVDSKKHYSMNINFVELFEYDTNLGNQILKNPDIALEELNQWIQYAQNAFIEESEDKTALTPKPHIHARVYGLPACPELHRNIFPKNDDLDLFLQITGTVVRVTSTKMLEYQRPYICTKCKHVAMVQAIYDQKYIITPPKSCLNSEECTGKNMVSAGDLNAENCKDYQEVKIQEQSSKLGVGSMPSSMWVTLENDLVDSCKPGDDVTICGIVKRRWSSLFPGKTIEVELVLKVNHIQVNNGQSSPSLITPEVKEQFTSFWEKYKNQPLEGRDLILKSFCPKLYGMYIVKLAVAVVLAGGSHCKQGNEVGIQIRSEPHILLVGDPGTGKSQLLRYAAKVVPRSVLTTGVGTTSAGLTVAAIMEDGQWQLEGGALVLADGGICCIDEFNSMKPHDRGSIHEAMEQQTISVAKASMVCKLRTCCSILAATNPKGGHLDPSQPLSLNLALPSPLLSRFDIVLMLKDTYDIEWDNLVADHILSSKGASAVKSDPSLWNMEILQQYFTIIRSLNPSLTPSTNKILSSYYQAQRRVTLRNKARTTVRLLDSLVRLSQAHARLMCHTEVQVMDALFAVVLIENSMHGECAVFSLEKINIQAYFVTNPMESYAQLALSILGKLGLHDILQNEIDALSNGYEYSVISDTEKESAENLLQTTETSVEMDNSAHVTISDNNCTSSQRLEGINVHLSDKHENLEPDVIKSPVKSKFFANKKEQRNEDIALRKGKYKNEDPKNKCDLSNKNKINSDNKKRKKIVTPKKTKKLKSNKNNDNLTDYQLMNLIRSANDDFDVSVLNFDDGDIDMSRNDNIEEMSTSSVLVNVDKSVISQTSKVRQEIREKFSFKPKILPPLRTSETNDMDDNQDNTKHNSKLLEDERDSVSHKVNEDDAEKVSQTTNNLQISSVKNVTEENSEKSANDHKSNSSDNDCINVNNQECKENKLSQNTRFRLFREKFSFRPVSKVNTNEVEGSSSKNCTNSVELLQTKVSDKKVLVELNKSQFPTSQSLFKSQDQDYDSLDVEF